MKTIDKIFLFFILIAFFILFHFNSLNTPFERDEGEYAYSAMILRKKVIPYKNSFLQKPPMIIYTYLLGQLINKEAVWPPRLIAAIFTFFSMILIGKIANQLWGEIAQWIAMFLFIPMIMFPPLTPFAANTEKFMILPLLVLTSFYFFNKNSDLCFFLGGVLISLTLSYKQISLLIIITICLLWLLKIYKEKKKITKVFRKILFLTIGALFSLMIIFLPFLSKEVLLYFFNSAIAFNLFYIKNFGSPFLNFFYYLKIFFYYWAILIPFIIFLLFFFPKKLNIIVILFFISLISIYSSPMGHYYLQIIPFFTLIIVASIIQIINLLPDNNKIPASIILTIIIIAFMIYPIKKQFYLKPEEFVVWIYGTVNPFKEAPVIAKKIKMITSANDKIFVAGSEAEIYFYSQRLSASRFVVTYPLNFDTPFRENYQNEVINDLKKNPPKIIVVSQRKHSGLFDENSPRFFINFLNNTIKKNYRLIGGYVWEDGQNGYWQEKLDKIAIKNSSYLVYLKK